MLSRRTALKGGTAAMAAMAAGGALPAAAVVPGSPVAAAAKLFWEADVPRLAFENNRNPTDAEFDAWDGIFETWYSAYERMMAIPSGYVQDLAAKVRVCREVWTACDITMEDPERLGLIFGEIERLAEEARS